MSRVISFKVVDEDGNEYEATCVLTTRRGTLYSDGTVSEDQDLLPKCHLKVGRSIVPIEEGVFQVVNTQTKLYVKED